MNGFWFVYVRNQRYNEGGEGVKGGEGGDGKHIFIFILIFSSFFLLIKISSSHLLSDNEESISHV